MVNFSLIVDVCCKVFRQYQDTLDQFLILSFLEVLIIVRYAYAWADPTCWQGYSCSHSNVYSSYNSTLKKWFANNHILVPSQFWSWSIPMCALRVSVSTYLWAFTFILYYIKKLYLSFSQWKLCGHIGPQPSFFAPRHKEIFSMYVYVTCMWSCYFRCHSLVEAIL
jgi:sensor histidine kinase YesM